MQNPEVNPVTGLGRTAADVQYEASKYKEKTRLIESTAVFDGDFLFVQVDGDIQLHRVANGVFMEDALTESILFTTLEYTHFPQAGYTGFCGHFRPKLNPNFDPKDRKSGDKFVRHHGRTREDVVVYDVGIFETAAPDGYDKKKLMHVTVDSLRRLARARPMYVCLPDEELPVTHGGRGEQTAADLSKKSVPELRNECKARGLSSTGRKAELIKRLQGEEEERGEESGGEESGGEEEGGEEEGGEEEGEEGEPEVEVEVEVEAQPPRRAVRAQHGLTVAPSRPVRNRNPPSNLPPGSVHHQPNSAL